MEFTVKLCNTQPSVLQLRGRARAWQAPYVEKRNCFPAPDLFSFPTPLIRGRLNKRRPAQTLSSSNHMQHSIFDPNSNPDPNQPTSKPPQSDTLASSPSTCTFPNAIYPKTSPPAAARVETSPTPEPTSHRRHQSRPGPNIYP